MEKTQSENSEFQSVNFYFSESPFKTAVNGSWTVNGISIHQTVCLEDLTVHPFSQRFLLIGLFHIQDRLESNPVLATQGHT